MVMNGHIFRFWGSQEDKEAQFEICWQQMKISLPVGFSTVLEPGLRAHAKSKWEARYDREWDYESLSFSEMLQDPTLDLPTKLPSYYY